MGESVFEHYVVNGQREGSKVLKVDNWVRTTYVEIFKVVEIPWGIMCYSVGGLTLCVLPTFVELI